jgi:hypothetical protein
MTMSASDDNVADVAGGAGDAGETGMKEDE